MYQPRAYPQREGAVAAYKPPRHRSHSSPRTSSRPAMYSSEGAVPDDRHEEASVAQLQEMREKSKILREQVLNVQRTVQSREGQLQRLRNERLPSEEVAQEEHKLSRIQDRISVQEARLRKLRETKTRIQQQTIINTAITAELDGLKNIVSNKEKEILQMDQLINQLNARLQQGKVENSNKSSKNAQHLHRIEKLKQEMMAHKRVTETVQGKFSSQREAVQSKKDEMKKVDLQISELWRKLQQAKAAQQQSSQKSATAIAAVGPFEHKPPGSGYPSSENRAPSPTKDQEIDIKLIERNGGSGQSSPSFSADEREPYSMRTVKMPPPLVPMNNHCPGATPESNQQMKSALARVKSHDGIWSSPTKSKSQLEKRASPSEMSNSRDGAWSPPTKPKTSSSQSEKRVSPSDIASMSQESIVPPTVITKNASGQSEKRVSPSDIASRSLDSVWVPTTKTTTSSSSSQTGKKVISGEINHKPKNDQVSNQSEKRASPNDMASRSKKKTSSPVLVSKPSVEPPSVNKHVKQAVTNRKEEMTSPSPRTSSPISKLSSPKANTVSEMKMEKGPVHQFKQAKGQGHSFSDPSKKFNSVPKPFGKSEVSTSDPPQGKVQGARYATRSQISDTYIQQVDKDRLEKYRKEMEKAVRDVSLSKQETPTTMIESNQESVSPPAVSVPAVATSTVSSPTVSKSAISTSAVTSSVVSSSAVSVSTVSVSTVPTSVVASSASSSSASSSSASSSSASSTSASSLSASSSSASSLSASSSPASSLSASSFSTSTSTTISSSAGTLAVSLAPSVPLPSTGNNTLSTTTVSSSASSVSIPVSSTPAVSTILPTPSVDVKAADNNTPSLTVLAPTDEVKILPPEVVSSDDEKHVEIYNPVSTEHSHIKSIIKKTAVDKADGIIRGDSARFHPLVLLLDASLNGTVDEVKEILPQVPDPSASNDEGITALHNAICAGHLDIVQTLVEFGVDVNAVDTDGWTPLHCAASCNNQPVVEYLLSRGACALATTYSDSETALEKCEMNEEGYDGTSKFLQDMEMKLGRDEPVYCVYEYKAESNDELTLHVNDKLTVLRRGDKDEQEWWWCKCGDREGYVAKNLLAFTPIVLPAEKKLHEQ